MTKKNILIFTLLLCVTISSAVWGVKKVFATNELTTDNANHVKDIINKNLNSEFGVVNLKDTDTLDNKKVYIAEDNSFTYKLDSENGNIVNMVANGVDQKLKATKIALTSETPSVASDKFLKKFAHQSLKCKYMLVKNSDNKNSNEDTHNFIYQEYAPNGIDTGWAVSVILNANNELVSLAVHSGNADLVQNTKPSLTKEDAIKIAQNKIYTDFPTEKLSSLPEAKAELTVFQDKLAWFIEINNIQINSSRFGYSFYIDATNGNILFNGNSTELLHN